MSESESASESEINPTAVKTAGGVIIKLDYPFKWGDEDEVTEVELKRPKGKHLKNLGGKATMSDLFGIASKVSGYDLRFFDELDGVDCMKVTDAIGDFLDGGDGTGKTS